MASTQHRGGSGNFAANPERAAQAGRKGGRMSGGNFRNNPERAAQAGQKGGQASGGNFRNDPKRASQAGRKGGQESQETTNAQHSDTANMGQADLTRKIVEGRDEPAADPGTPPDAGQAPRTGE